MRRRSEAWRPELAASTDSRQPAGRDRPPRGIAHVITESEPFGGAQRNTLLSLEGLKREGYEVELICGPGGRLVGAARAIGVAVHEILDLVREVAPLHDLRAFLALFRLMRARNYEVVHTHSTKAGLLGRVAAWCAGVPIVVHTFHGVPFRMQRDTRTFAYSAVERLAALVTHRVVCVGEAFRQELAGWGVAPPHKLVTIYSGIDFSSCRPRRPAAELKRDLGLERAWPVIGSVGRLTQQKAQYDLIDAVALLASRYPRIVLLLVGEGPLRARLERQIRERDLAPRVRLLGERDDIADLLGVFDVFAMSSLWEGVGRALTEAMYARLPVVATAVDGVVELILDDETGLLVPPRSPATLAAAIERLVSEPERATRLGANARAKAAELMDGRSMVAALVALYEELRPSLRPGRSRPSDAAASRVEPGTR